MVKVERSDTNKISIVPIASCFFVKIYFFYNEFEICRGKFAAHLAMRIGIAVFGSNFHIFNYMGGIYHWGQAGFVGGWLVFLRVVGFFIILNLLVESLQESTAKSVPPLERVEIWGLAGWLESVWEGDGEVVKMVGVRG